MAFVAGWAAALPRVPRPRACRGRAPVALQCCASSAPEPSSVTTLPGAAAQPFAEQCALSAAVLPKPALYVMSQWYQSYLSAAAQSTVEGCSTEAETKQYADAYFSTLLELVKAQVQHPYRFECYHQAVVRSPADSSFPEFDYYNFGLEFARPLFDSANSLLHGKEHLADIEEAMARGENVIILANHQSEGDPHGLDLVLQTLGDGSTLARRTVFMAGDRVRNDPLVVPFSLGRNLLTVYSKKHIDDVPEEKTEKQQHNRRTVAMTEQIFRSGGVCLWLAPSGGRDRRSAETSRVEIADFDPDAIELMRFTARRSRVKTRFYPMALVTYNLLPPPETLDKDLGEARVVQYTPLFVGIGPELDFAAAEASAPEGADKVALRQARASAAQEAVRILYEKIGGYQQ